MKFGSAVAIYFITGWVCLFVVLPFGAGTFALLFADTGTFLAFALAMLIALRSPLATSL